MPSRAAADLSWRAQPAGGKHSHGLRRHAAIESGRGSFEDTTAAITRATGVTLGKRQVEELARRAAADIDAFYAARRPWPAIDDQLLVLTCDGKGIPALQPGATQIACRQALTPIFAACSHPLAD